MAECSFGPAFVPTWVKRTIMKRVILSTIMLVGLTAFAAAQTSGNSSKNTGAVSNSSKNKNAKKAKPSERLNNRKIYHFKNGQRSTPTGNEATPVGGGYSALGNNRASAAKSDTLPRSKGKQ